MHKQIAKITGTFLGASEETHGVFTAQLVVSYGGGLEQAIAGYNLAGDSGFAGAFIRGILRAAGADSWERLVGRTILVLTEHDPSGESGYQPVLGIENLPTEPGRPFVFGELAEQYRTKAHR